MMPLLLYISAFPVSGSTPLNVDEHEGALDFVLNFRSSTI
jgi:hypothetical protein